MKKLILILSLFLCQNIWAQYSQELYFVHFKATTKKQRNLIANNVHIDSIIEDSVYTSLNKADYLKVKKELGHLIVESHPLEFTPINSTQADDYEFPEKDSKYHTYTEVVNELKEYARRFPKIVTFFSLGTSVEGRDIPAIRITASENTSKDAFVPGILFLGSHHAREHLSTEVPMNIIKHLLDNAETDSNIKALISSRDIYFAPLINPDGALHDIKGRKYKSWRKNRSVNARKSFGVDLNRNYSFGWGTGGSSRRETSDVYMGPKPFSEPETSAVKSFIDAHANIRILLSFHTFSELILYPWGGKTDSIGGRDQLVFEKMAKKMSKWNGYKPEQASDLYVASGDTCDWAYGEHGIFCFTFELSPKSMWRGGFYPGANMIKRATKANINPALYLINKAENPYSVIK